MNGAFGVAAGARHIAMGALQRKIRVQLVIEFHRPPARLIVTAGAVRAVGLPVHIIRPMTVDAGSRQIQGKALSMAGFADDLFMPPQQGEIGASGMIEGDLLPALRHVTGLTSASESAEVAVFSEVARDAFR